MSKDYDQKKPVRTNAGLEPHPPGVVRSGVAPRGMAGTEKPNQRESDMVMGPLYLQDGDQRKGPYFLMNLDPNSLADGKGGKPAQTRPVDPDKGKYRFHETGDEEVDRDYASRDDHVMVHDPRLDRSYHEAEAPARDDAGRDAKLDEHYREGASSEGWKEGERDPKLDRLYADKNEGHDQGTARDDDLGRDSEPPEDWLERERKGRGGR